MSEQRQTGQTRGSDNSSSTGQATDKSVQSRPGLAPREPISQHSHSSTSHIDASRFPQSNHQQHAGPSRYTSQTQSIQRNSREATISRQPRTSAAAYNNPTAQKTYPTPNTPNKLLLRTRKPRSNRRPRKNVFIPTTLTVATLAKLLKVKLGKCNIGSIPIVIVLMFVDQISCFIE